MISPNDVDGNTSFIDSYAQMRAHFLINSELWQDEVAHWRLPAGDFSMAQLIFDYTDALAMYGSSRSGRSVEALARLEADAKATIAVLDQRKMDEPGERSDIALVVDQMRALFSSADPNSSGTVNALQIVAARENGLPLEFGPPAVFKPTEEIIGEIYLRMHRPAEARKAFDADLARAPGRRLGMRGLMQSEAPGSR